MENIKQNLLDPAWWFTVVFIGIIVGIIAASLRNSIGTLLSHLSNRYRIRKEKSDHEEQLLVNRWANNHVLLILQNFLLIRGLILFTALLVTWVMATILNMNTLYITKTPIVAPATSIGTLIFGLIIVVFMYYLTRVHRLILKANKIYRQNLESDTTQQRQE
jgi:hypothetical protein